MATFVPRFLRQLRDIVIATPADGEVLTYDSADQKWKNEAGGSGGAPTTADYLTGTAQAGLSAEIVVGTTPGGELGNTWASPTVDATHSGSSHASVQTAAEATAAAALAAHVSADVVDGDTAGGVLSGTYPSPGFASDMATQAELDAHLNDTTDAHDASAVSFVPTGTIAATDVQAAIAEAASESSNLTGAVILAPASSARNVIQPTAGSVIDAIFKAHASQSVDLTQWQKSDGTVQASIDSMGLLRVVPGGTVAANVFNKAPAYLVGLEGAFGSTTNYWLSIGRSPTVSESTTYGGGQIFNAIYVNGAVLSPETDYYSRAASDGHINATLFLVSHPTFGGFTAYDDDENSGITTKAIQIALNGFYTAGVPEGWQLFDDYNQTSPQFILQKLSGAWKFGIFGATPVAQQSASTIAALWTALKNHGWLTSGSTAPSLYLPGGTDVAVADGGTGASTDTGARTNLGAAPLAATYITQTANSELSAEQALGALATGLLKNTTTTGVLSIGAAGTDYYNPGGTDVAVADGGTGASTAAAALTNLGAQPALITTNRQTASYGLVLADAGLVVEMNVGSGNNLTVPLNATQAFATGTVIGIHQYGAGQTTIVATGGVTIRSPGAKLKLTGQYSSAAIRKVGTDEWILTGDITT